MQTPFLSHDLHAEFPDLADRLHTLKTTNTHFSRIFEQYQAVDNDIVKAEEGIAPLADFSLEDLKKRRLRIKDELYQMLRAS